MDDIKDIIKHMREEAGLSQKQLADKLEVARTTISGYELGRNIPNFNTVKAIAKICDFEIIFKDTNNEEIIAVKKK
ncbi:helix-turn-helix domain-containing protein, partial [Christensenellaceae bacterium OttesenSCG-928-M15]|nr:helix-turn-helix domain-containing protein [Christensenellaceae bacterium OttesenSCG-928-M15]